MDVEPGDGESSTTLFAAIRTVVVADAVMSLDNVIAIAAAARDSLLLLVIRLVVSMPLIIVGSTLVLKVIERFPLLVLMGGALLGWIAGEVVVTDPVLVDWVEREAHYLHDWYIARIVGAVFVVIVGPILARMIEARRRQKGRSRILNSRQEAGRRDFAGIVEGTRRLGRAASCLDFVAHKVPQSSGRYVTLVK